MHPSLYRRYDRHQKELEERLDEKTAQLIHLQRVAMEHALVDGSSSMGADAGDAAGGGAAGTALEDAPSNLVSRARARMLGGEWDEWRSSASGAGGASAGATTAERDANTNAERAANDALASVVESQKAELVRVRAELEDMEAEKLSLEVLLREKLEKLVQSEIESRLESYRGNQGSALLLASHNKLRTELSGKLSEMARLRRDLESSRGEVERLRRAGPSPAKNRAAHAEAEASAAAQHARANASAAAAATAAAAAGTIVVPEQRLLELEASERRCDVHAKERAAIETIMEQKIKRLVDAIAVHVARSAGARGSRGAHAGQQVLRDVGALQRLVNASIAALRQSP